MEKLLEDYNPNAVTNVMCGTPISVGWDSFIYDCDFNQIPDLKIKSEPKHNSEFNFDQLCNREIVVNQHCYGCNDGTGSSRGGTLA